MAVHAIGVTAPVTTVTTAETVVGVVGPLPEDTGVGAESCIWIQAELVMTTGARTTGVTVRIRRGNGITGAIVGGSTGVIAAGAAAVVGLSWAAVDTAAIAATPEQIYSVTVQAAAATGNGSVIGVLTAQPGVVSN